MAARSSEVYSQRFSLLGCCLLFKPEQSRVQAWLCGGHLWKDGPYLDYDYGQDLCTETENISKKYSDYSRISLIPGAVS